MAARPPMRLSCLLPAGRRNGSLGGALRACHACAAALGTLLLACGATGCDTPSTTVVLENEYPRSAERPLVVYDAVWETVEWKTPIPPGTSSDPQPTVATSGSTAYVLLAPGWDAKSGAPPAEYVLLQSRDELGLRFAETLEIPVDDATFAGNCASGSHLSQAQADFMTQLVFAGEFGALGYDAATCTARSGP
jgi:hypothetical protein